MNHPSPEHKSYYRKSEQRKKHSSITAMSLAMIIVPVVLLIVLFSHSLRSNGTNDTKEFDNVYLNISGAETEEKDNGFTQTTFQPLKQSETEQSEENTPLYTDREVELIAKTIYGEALVTDSDMEMAAVAWCILNRVDNAEYPDTIEDVITQKRQFHGYNEENPVTARIESLVRDVLDRWYAEKGGNTNCGRVLPKDYIYFDGDGRHNHYSTEWRSEEYWDWSLPNPYEN